MNEFWGLVEYTLGAEGCWMLESLQVGHIIFFIIALSKESDALVLSCYKYVFLC